MVALLSWMHTRIARAVAADLATRLELCVRGAQLPSRRRVPNVRKYQRQQQVYRRVPTPALCACGESLGAVQTAKLTADHAIAPAQRQVFDVIDSGATSFGAFEANRNSVATCWPPLGAWRMAS